MPREEQDDRGQLGGQRDGNQGPEAKILVPVGVDQSSWRQGGEVLSLDKADCISRVRVNEVYAPV